MSLQRQLLIWAAVLAVLLYFLSQLGSVVTPFAAGIALGYLLDPLAHRLERLGMNRLAAALLIMVVFATAVIWGLAVLAPILGGQFLSFSAHLPDYIVKLRALAVDQAAGWLGKYGADWLTPLGLNGPEAADQIQKWVAGYGSQGAQWLADALRSLVSGGASIVNFLSLMVITPVVGFYMLVDWHKMTAELDSWIPRDYRDSVRGMAREIDKALSGFIRGQSLVCLFLGAWDGLGLSLVGLDFGLLIGVVAGVLSFMPYVGTLVAFVFSLGIGLVQGWPSLKLVSMALAVVISGEFIGSYVISPKVVGESIGLHPVWLMFALLAFGELFGFVGLIIAVPAAAAIGVLARHLIALYLRSPLYRGAGGHETPGPGPAL